MKRRPDRANPRRLAIAILVFVVLAAAATARGEEEQPPRPNVVLVMSDDQGWGEVSFAQERAPGDTYRGHRGLKTPELAKMAAAGIRFDRFYSASPVCSPTRASVLTGRHAARMGILTANSGKLPTDEVTVAEIAQKLGYVTGHFGKWHLGTLDYTVRKRDGRRGGKERRPESQRNYSAPWQSGFDRTFSLEGAAPTWDPMVDANFDARYWTGQGRFVEASDPRLRGDTSRILMDETRRFIDEAIAAEKPFLAVVWLHTPHKPWRDHPDALEAFFSDEERAAMSKGERRYYSSIANLDRQIGLLRSHLRAKEIAGNTVVFFCSDNGPMKDAPRIADDATGGLRGFKEQLWEGGIRVPAIVEWPGTIEAGRATSTPASTSDYLPTLLDIWRVPMPDERALDGESLLAVLDGSKDARSRALRFEFSRRSQRAILDAAGRYKAISLDDGKAWQLFDLLADPTESRDLAAESPEKLGVLVAEWTAWYTSLGRTPRRRR